MAAARRPAGVGGPRTRDSAGDSAGDPAGSFGTPRLRRAQAGSVGPGGTRPAWSGDPAGPGPDPAGIQPIEPAAASAGTNRAASMVPHPLARS